MKEIGLGYRCFIVFCCMSVDFCINGYRVHLMDLDMFMRIAMYGMALVFAISPALITLHGDDKAYRMGIFACIGTIVFSCWSIYGVIDQKHKDASTASQRIALLEQQAQADAEINRQSKEVCAGRRLGGIGGCDSIAFNENLKQESAEYFAKANALLSSAQPVGKWEGRITGALMILLSIMAQIIGTEAARQIVHISGGAASERSAAELKAEKRSNIAKKGSLTRNSAQKQGSGTVLSGNFEPKKP